MALSLGKTSAEAASRRRRVAAAAVIWLLPLAWLLPNHHLPWATAWQDGLALFTVAALALLLRAPMQVPAVWAMFAAVGVLTVAVQWVSGVLAFAGDAWMVLLYLGAFVLALGIARAHAARPHGDALEGASPSHLALSLAWGIVAAALVSGALALLQWLQQPLLGPWMVALPPGGRPFANFGQPNHLSSAAVLAFGALLWLHQVRRLANPVLWVTGTAVLAIVAMTGSRTGLLQIAVLLGGALMLKVRLGLRLRRREALAFGLITVALVTIWPTLNQALTLDNARPVQQLASESVRGPVWRLLLQAVGDAPWLGHGWLQVAQAQWSVALEAPPIHRLFEHSHNLAVDLLVWVGVPAGSLLFLLILLGVAGPDPRQVNAQSFWLRMMGAALLVHGLLEYPLEHAYFLLPTGLLLGFAVGLEARAALPAGSVAGSVAGRPTLHGMALSGLALALATALTAADYIRAEIDHRALRMASARIGGGAAPPVEPLNLRVLDQLEALLSFARAEARAGMSAVELASFTRVALRYPIPPALLRLALAQGLNGRPEAAADTLARLCRMHDPLRCEEGRQSWAAVQEVHPALKAVPYPAASTPAR